MKTLPTVLTAIVAVSTIVHAETVYVVEVSQFDGNREYLSLSSDEARSLESDIRNEGRFYSKALKNAETAWAADETKKDDTFPARSIQQRKVRRLKMVRSMEEAEKLVDQYEERTLRSRERKEDQKRTSRSQRGSNSNQMRDKARDDNAKRIHKAEMEAEAVEMFREQLDRLLNPQAEKKAPAVEEH